MQVWLQSPGLPQEVAHGKYTQARNKELGTNEGTAHAVTAGVRDGWRVRDEVRLRCGVPCHVYTLFGNKKGYFGPDQMFSLNSPALELSWEAEANSL